MTVTGQFVQSFHLTQILDKPFGQVFNMRTYAPVTFIGMVAGAGGINGCIALWLNKDFEAGSNELQNNFRTFLIITIIVNSFVSIQTIFFIWLENTGIFTGQNLDRRVNIPLENRIFHLNV